VNYDAEIARLVDVYSSKVAKLTGKPEHRKQGAMRLLAEMAEAMKKVVREATIEFYEKKTAPAPRAEPLFAGSVQAVPSQPPVSKPGGGTPPGGHS
jgi:hypothetical protein